MDIEKLFVIIDAENGGLSMEQINRVVNLNYGNIERMKYNFELLINSWEENVLPKDKCIQEIINNGTAYEHIIKRYDFNVDQLYEIEAAEKDGLDKYIEKIANPKYSADHMEALHKALLQKLTPNSIDGLFAAVSIQELDKVISNLFLNKEGCYDTMIEQKVQIKDNDIEKKYLNKTPEYIEMSPLQTKFVEKAKRDKLCSALLMEKYIFNFKQLKIIREAEEAGLNFDQLTLLSDPIIKEDIMKEIFNALLNNAPSECIDYMKVATTIDEAKEVLEAYMQ